MSFHPPPTSRGGGYRHHHVWPCVCASVFRFRISGLNNLKVRNYSSFTITFPMIWRCAGDFSRFHLNLKWPPQINFIICVQMQKNYPSYGNVQLILLKFKWPPLFYYLISLFFVSATTQNIIYGRG